MSITQDVQGANHGTQAAVGVATIGGTLALKYYGPDFMKKLVFRGSSAERAFSSTEPSLKKAEGARAEWRARRGLEFRPKPPHGTGPTGGRFSNPTDRIIRVAKGSEAQKLLDSRGHGYWLTGDITKSADEMTTLDFKTKMGILDIDPDGGYRAGRPDIKMRSTYVDAMYGKTPHGVAGRAARRLSTAYFETTPWGRILRKAGISFSGEQELAALKQADAKGLKGQKAIDFVSETTAARFGTHYYPDNIKTGGELVTGKTGTAPQSTKTPKTDVTKVPSADAPKVPTTDVAPGSKISKYFGKGTKFIGKSLPVVAGLDDASVVLQDIKEGDVTGAVLHSGDAAIDFFLGPVSLLVTVPTNYWKDDDSPEVRGFFSTIAHWVGIEEEVKTSSAIEHGVNYLMDENEGSAEKKSDAELSDMQQEQFSIHSRAI